MAHLSVATAIEKNKIASDKAFLILFEVEIVDDTNTLVETLRIAKNSEAYEFQGNLYQPGHFSIDISESINGEPSLKVQADDPSGLIRERMDAYSGGVGFLARVYVVNTGAPDQPAEISEEFQIVNASTKGFTVDFTLGIDNPLFQRFPNRLQYKDQCTLRFKGPLCKYAGPDSTCSFTWGGTNGCKAKNNSENFGGFRGLQSLS